MLTNSVALSPLSITAMLPQGSLMFGPAQVATSWPLASSTSRQPSPLVRGGAVVAGRAADDHPAALQHRHRRGQPDAAGALRQMLRQLGEQLVFLVAGL